MSQISFLPEKPKRIVPGTGSQDARIAIVGEAPGAYEDMQLKPFVGPAGSVLEQCLHAAGLLRSDVYLTNVVKVRPPANKIDPYFNGRTFSEEGWKWVASLREELNEHKANVIVAAGKTAMCALTGLTKIRNLRGYVLESIGLERVRKVIPTIHPAASLYQRKEANSGGLGSLSTADFKPYLYRHVIACDLKKAKSESEYPELKRPERQLIWNFGSASEVLEWLEYYERAPILSIDIEVLNYELSCIAFSCDPSVAISVPLAGKWTESDEALIWRGIQKVLKTGCPKIFQNGIFDIRFLLVRCGMIVNGPVHDTMVAHHIMFPELPKSLEFQGSIYCGAQQYWKDAVKFDNIKEES